MSLTSAAEAIGLKVQILGFTGIKTLLDKAYTPDTIEIDQF